MTKTDLWDALGKTDPAHTKKFSRAGGFKGTAVKPMWVYRRLTEQFGPVGMGWGHNKPDFQVINGNNEILVYCTVECWHSDRANTFYGVGGDKVVTQNKNGLVTSDEAFKSAFTDAVMNAFKSVGVAADVHMGLHDDDKYVEQLEEEFAPSPDYVSAEQLVRLQSAAYDCEVDVPKFCKWANVPDLAHILASDFDRAMKALNSKKKAAA